MKAGDSFTDLEQKICRVIATTLLGGAIIIAILMYQRNAAIIPGMILVLPLAFLNFVVWRYRLVW